MANKIGPNQMRAHNWLSFEQPLPEQLAADSADKVMDALKGHDTGTQMAIMSTALFRLQRANQNVRLLDLFIKDLRGRYELVESHRAYVEPKPK